MPLSDINIKTAKPKDKPYKLADGNGMYLLIHPNGGKYFRLDYRMDGKRKTLALGTYPNTSLAKVREMTLAARKQIVDGIDPSGHKQATKAVRLENAANSLEVIAHEFGLKNITGWQDTFNKQKRRLERYIFPYLGKKPVNQITAKDILQCLRRIEERGTVETAHRTLQLMGQILRYAVASSRAELDVTQALRGALQPNNGGHFAAITEPKQAAELLRAIDSYQGSFVALCALKLAPMVFVRPGELRSAKWQDIDLETKEWRYLVTKTNTQHIVPLSSQAIALLKQLEPLTGGGVWLFPSERNPNNTLQGRCMSDNTLNAALKRLGYPKEQMSIHGFRAMARTILDERLGWRVDYIEHQLAHAVRDPNGRAYNRTAHLPERHKMMQQWADYLDSLKAGAEVVPFRKTV